MALSNCIKNCSLWTEVLTRYNRRQFHRANRLWFSCIYSFLPGMPRVTVLKVVQQHRLASITSYTGTSNVSRRPDPNPQIYSNQLNEKSARRKCKHCMLAVVRRSQKICPATDPFTGVQDSQNLISWRWSLPLRINLGWDRCTQFQVIVVTDPQTHPTTHRQDRPITIHSVGTSVQCNKKKEQVLKF